MIPIKLTTLVFVGSKCDEEHEIIVQKCSLLAQYASQSTNIEPIVMDDVTSTIDKEFAESLYNDTRAPPKYPTKPLYSDTRVPTWYPTKSLYSDTRVPLKYPSALLYSDSRTPVQYQHPGNYNDAVFLVKCLEKPPFSLCYDILGFLLQVH